MNKVRITALMLSLTGKTPKHLTEQLSVNEFELLCKAYESLQSEFDPKQLGYLLTAEDIRGMMSLSSTDESTSYNHDISFSEWLEKAEGNIPPHTYEIFRKLTEKKATMG